MVKIGVLHGVYTLDSGQRILNICSKGPYEVNNVHKQFVECHQCFYVFVTVTYMYLVQNL